MCKVGILLIGLDLYHSASTLFHNLILHKSGSPFDLAAHIFALLTLFMAYRGRVRRNIAGKVVLPVMMVNWFKLLLAGNFVTFLDTAESTGIGSSNNGNKLLEWSFFDNNSATGYDRLMVLKSALFCWVMFRLAFQGIDSFVGKDEWFPWQMEGVCGGGGGETVEDEKEE